MTSQKSPLCKIVAIHQDSMIPPISSQQLTSLSPFSSQLTGEPPLKHQWKHHQLHYTSMAIQKAKGNKERNKQTTHNTKSVMEEENLSPGCKNLPPNHQSKISTKQDSCNTLGLYESSKLQLATNFSESFLFLSYRRTSIEAPMETPPMKIGFSDVASHISLAILSLAGMCLWLRNVFTKSQSME